MNGVRLTVHQSSSRIDRRKLVSITRSPSVAIVSEIAPKWIMPSSLRPSNQPDSSEGGTTSSNRRLARLRHLPARPSTSHTATSLRPASFSAATTFDPIKPAPPVTSNIDIPVLIDAASFAPLLPDRQPRPSRVVKANGALIDPLRWLYLPRGSRYRRDVLSPASEPDQVMNPLSLYGNAPQDTGDDRPILIVPYMWIGDFVRGHTVVRVLKQRWPNRPVDLLATSLCAPLVDYMPGVRAGIVWDLPRGRLALTRQWGLAALLRERNYGTALVLPGTWKSAIAPALAGIPERAGFFGEVRLGLLNRIRWGERGLPRFIDKNASLALPAGVPLPAEWPVPQLQVRAGEIEHWGKVK